MKEVLNKLEKIYDELALAKAQALQNKELFSSKDKALDLIKEKLDARDKMISARERIVSKLEVEEDMKQDLNTLKLEVQLHNEDLDKKEKSLNAKLAKYAKDKKAHDSMVDMYKIKSARVGKIEEDMIELKKNMKKVILKEIGDKLSA
jgi:hypothetical protein